MSSSSSKSVVLKKIKTKKASSKSAALNLDEQKRDWLGLPYDITTNILNRIGANDILENVQKVCTEWRKICKDPAMWRVIKIDDLMSSQKYKQAVDRSQGQLVDLTIRCYCSEEVISYVAKRSRRLRRLEIIFSPFMIGRLDEQLLKKFPLLEELNVYSFGAIKMNKEFIESVGRHCPMLKTLKVNQTTCKGGFKDDVAIAIGENLNELRHLELIGSKMSNIGLEVILDGCCRLETLDLRNCFRVDLNGDVWKRCVEQINSLKTPNESLDGFPYTDINEKDHGLYDDDNYGCDSPEIYDGCISQ